MKKINTVLVFCALFLSSCQTEPLNRDNISAQNNQDETQENSEAQECETLFAIGDDSNSKCFLEDGFNRWGWTIGPLVSGDYSFDLYSGAGQCDITKGELVGTLTVNYNELESVAEVQFEMTEGFILNETHLYIGNNPYPTDDDGNSTVAPGQFPDQHELDAANMDSYSVGDLSGPIYVIAHGVVCDDNDDDDDNGGGGSF